MILFKSNYTKEHNNNYKVLHEMLVEPKDGGLLFYLADDWESHEHLLLRFEVKKLARKLNIWLLEREDDD